MISAGIDAGTLSYDIVVLDGDRVIYEASLSTDDVRRNPELILKELESCNAEVAAGLSGYGMPIKRFSELDEVDVFLMTLNFERNRTLGLRKIVELVKSKKFNLYTIPGVIHLPTVPRWRKINKIDMGTADKLCSAVLAVYQLSQDVPLEKQNFVLAEVGYFNAFIAVKEGRIVDGLGGTSGFPGYGSIGALDAELAYLLGKFPKDLVFSGGIRNLGDDATSVLAEFVLKGLRAVEVSVGKAELCVLSGRFAEDVRKFVEEHYDVVVLKGFGKGKQSAQGAAIVANAIAGGEFKKIVDHMKIFDAKGTVLDYITPDVMEYLRKGMIGRVESGY